MHDLSDALQKVVNLILNYELPLGIDSRNRHMAGLLFEIIGSHDVLSCSLNKLEIRLFYDPGLIFNEVSLYMTCASVGVNLCCDMVTRITILSRQTCVHLLTNI